MYIAKIRVTLRSSILDPQGKAVQHAMATMGARKVRDVRIGKYIEASIDVDSEIEARQMAEEVCRKLLANPVMEDYSYDIVRGA